MDEQTKDSTSSLHWEDYVVISIMLSISTGIGLYYRFTGGRQRTAEEYFSANKSMGVVSLAIALTVSLISAITLLGMSAENYIHGTQIALFYFGSIIGTPIALYFYIPVFSELDTMSVYEYLERRFGVGARLMTSIANFIHLTLFSGVVLFAPSLALEETTGLSGNISILLIGLICTFYSTTGGIKAVLITDVFQGVLMYAGIAAILIVGAMELEGGLSSVWGIAEKGQRLTFFDFRLDPTIPHTWWSMIIGSTTMFLSICAVNQVQLQRLLAAKSPKVARNALLLSGPITVCLGCLTCFTGLLLYAVYLNCDPLTSGQINSPDKIMPFFAADKLSRYPGLTGFFISGVFSASLSTISAVLNSLAAVILEDYMKPSCKKLGLQFPNDKATMIGKGLTIANGFLCLSTAFLARSMGALVEIAISISGVINGPILGIFTLGMFFESANEVGAITGMTSALIVCLWAMFGGNGRNEPRLPLSVEGCDNSTLLNLRNVTPAQSPIDNSDKFYLYRISYMWYNLMGMTITVLVGYLASLATRKIFYKDATEPDPSLFTPFVAARIRRRREDVARTTNSQVFMMDNVK